VQLRRLTTATTGSKTVPRTTTRSAAASGKTAASIRHLAEYRLSDSKGAKRLWLEGRRLADIGLDQGVRYDATVAGDTLHIRLAASGSHKVSRKQTRPVIDLHTRALGPVDWVQARFLDSGEVIVSVHPVEKARLARLERLNARMAAGQPLRLGSLSHGGGIASDAMLRGLHQAGVSGQLAFGLDINPEYLAQSLEHNPAWKAGGMSVEASIATVDTSVLPQVDVLEAGLPCVAASRAGRSKKGLRRPEQDARVGHLAYGFLRIIEATQPAVIVLENVPEYSDSASADIIRGQLAEWGYEVSEHTVDGAAWSLEARTRWVMVAVTRGMVVDTSALAQGGDRPANLGQVLDRKTPAASWRKFEGQAAHEARHAAAGHGFKQRILTPASVAVPTLRRGYQKAGTTDPRLAHPTRKGYSRLLSPAEHARIKGIDPKLVAGLSATVAHEVLGQSVISPAFRALGSCLGASVTSKEQAS